eukprot:6025128-Heterocapsa_arctica.AAC.1
MVANVGSWWDWGPAWSLERGGAQLQGMGARGTKPWSAPGTGRYVSAGPTSGLGQMAKKEGHGH